MAEPELAFSRKTFDDAFGRHALVYDEGTFRPRDGRRDVHHLTRGPDRFPLTRMPEGYQPRHAVADCNTSWRVEHPSTDGVFIVDAATEAAALAVVLPRIEEILGAPVAPETIIIKEVL